MIAHIRQSEPPQPAPPIVRARRMVAETLLADEPERLRRRARRKGFVLGLLIGLAGMAAVVYYFLR